MAQFKLLLSLDNKISTTRHRRRLKQQRTEKIVIDKNSFRVNKNRNVGKTKTIPHRTEPKQAKPTQATYSFGMKSKEVKHLINEKENEMHGKNNKHSINT